MEFTFYTKKVLENMKNYNLSFIPPAVNVLFPSYYLFTVIWVIINEK